MAPPPLQLWTSWAGCWCWTVTRGSARQRPWHTPTSASTTTRTTSPRRSLTTRAWRPRSARWRSGRVGPRPRGVEAEERSGEEWKGGAASPRLALAILSGGSCSSERVWVWGHLPPQHWGGRGQLELGLGESTRNLVGPGREAAPRGWGAWAAGGLSARLPLPAQSSPTRKSSASSPQSPRSRWAAWTLSSDGMPPPAAPLGLKRGPEPTCRQPRPARPPWGAPALTPLQPVAPSPGLGPPSSRCAFWGTCSCVDACTGVSRGVGAQAQRLARPCPPAPSQGPL